MAQTTKKAPEKRGEPPVKVWRNRGVKVAVFENQGNEQTFFKVSLQRIYKDGDEWKTTTSLGRDDLPVARMLLGRAWEFILEHEANRNRENTETPAD